MPAVVVSLVAKKGGVGRTTLAINLAGAFASESHRVLVVDMEGQASLSQFFLGPETVEQLSKVNATAALFDDALYPDPATVIRPTHVEGIWLAPSTQDLAAHELPQPEATGPLQFTLRDFILEVADSFDTVLIDTPPNIYGLLCWSALMASQFVITPLHPETFSSQALVGVQRIVEKAMRQGNPQLELLGYVINLREKRPVLQNLTEERVRRIHGKQVFDTVVPKNQAFADAIAYQKPVTEYKPRSQPAKIIRQLASELMARILANVSKTTGSKVA